MAKAKQTETAAEPITFDEINRRKVRERVEAYRDIVTRRATGGTITVADMERAAELLEQLGLPQYTFDRDVDAVQRFKGARDKWQAAADAAPDHATRATELAAEVEALTKKLAGLREQLHLANAKRGKPETYRQTLAQLQHDHPHVLADLDQAVRLRIEELDRRKRATVGGAA